MAGAVYIALLLVVHLFLFFALGTPLLSLVAAPLWSVTPMRLDLRTIALVVGGLLVFRWQLRGILHPHGGTLSGASGRVARDPMARFSLEGILLGGGPSRSNKSYPYLSSHPIYVIVDLMVPIGSWVLFAAAASDMGAPPSAGRLALATLVSGLPTLILCVMRFVAWFGLGRMAPAAEVKFATWGMGLFLATCTLIGGGTFLAMRH